MSQQKKRRKEERGKVELVTIEDLRCIVYLQESRSGSFDDVDYQDWYAQRMISSDSTWEFEKGNGID